ncbi:transcriptional regulator [Fulvimarina sp. 2208YS6-2-32]|uniref:Transcriptional regulator n=1 Tax=Fulvimarina uroteuthidis TaxID=3098149 RepID=A0ABU5HXW9_9HYPH|nr:transcriptional regulator [Fulvimarina sp. 2208YS6-2-32]MDY8107983.1 transcriptional regulator [Fulvimarina sp. 2208YS6-2-32]
MPIASRTKKIPHGARGIAVSAWVAAFGFLCSFANDARAAELIMLEQPGCVWCKAFDEEIAPAYARSGESQIAPLRRVDITQDWPADLEDVRKERLTPTFVLLDDGGTEVDRMRGYPGDEFFWGLLGEMLAKLPAAGAAPGPDAPRRD